MKKTILHVEDDAGDHRLLIEAFKEAGLRADFVHVTDGEQALALLRGHGGLARAQRPDLVILDLNLPRMGGREVLKALKQHREWRRIPVVVLSASQGTHETGELIELGAVASIMKPSCWNDYLRLACSLGGSAPGARAMRAT